MKRNVIVGLDLVRFSAATLVVLFHYAFGVTAFQYPEIINVASMGWVGVEIFFVLSGFVICYTAGHSPAKFVKSRILRLVPAMLVAATATGALLYTQGFTLPDLALRWIKSVSFLPFRDIIDGVYWTLQLEVMFYAMVYLLLLSGQRGRLESLLTGIGFLTFTFYLARLLRKLIGESPDFPLFSAYLDLTDVVTFIKFGCYFGLGGLMYLLLIDRFTVRRLALVVFFLLMGGLYIYELTPANSHNAAPRHMALLIWLVAIVAMVLSVRFNGVLTRLLSARMTRTLGLATYPFYLIHGPIGEALIHAMADQGITRWPALVLAILIMCLASIAISLVLEPPIGRFLLAVARGLRSGWARLRPALV